MLTLLQVCERASLFLGLAVGQTANQFADSLKSLAFADIAPERGWAPAPLAALLSERAASSTRRGLSVRKMRLPEVHTTAVRRRGSRRLTLARTSLGTIGISPCEPPVSVPVPLMKIHMRPTVTSTQSRQWLAAGAGLEAGRVLRKMSKSPRRQRAGG